jgi:3''-Phosphoadenosine 5''-phosphosulfate (PAPS) 3''-phosphatase
LPIRSRWSRRAEADATLNLDGLNEWDVAGGVLLIEEAGGTVMDRNGSPLSFNQSNTTIRGILAADKDCSIVC